VYIRVYRNKARGPRGRRVERHRIRRLNMIWLGPLFIMYK